MSLPLTPREDDVCRRLLTSRTLVDIAAELGITVATLRVYNRHVYNKKHVKNRLELMEREIEKKAPPR